MKFSSLVLLSLIACCTLSKNSLNYNNPSAGQLGCSISSGQTVSPVNLLPVGCSPYGTFELNLPNVPPTEPTASGTLNNFFVPINGTNNTLNFNGTLFNAQLVAFHSPSETAIDGVQADLEMQVYFNNSATNVVAAVVSFLFYSPNTTLYNNSLLYNGRQFILNQTQNNYIYNLSSEAWAFNLSQLSTMINNKSANDAFLNFLTFESTLNFDFSSSPSNLCQNIQWFVYAGGLYVPSSILQQFADLINNNASQINIVQNPNGTVSNSLYAGNNFLNLSNTITATKMCYSGYFLVTMNSNYGLWFAWGLTVLFFIITLVLDEKPIENVDYVENAWTHHPLYSVAIVGNNTFTRKSRCASILVQIINQFAWNGVFFAAAFQNSPSPNAIDLIINPAIAMAIGWGVLYFIGFFLRMYYLKKAEYEASYENNRDDKNDSAQFYIYMYYFFVFALVCVGFSFTISSLDQVQSYNNPQTANFWVAAVFIGLAFDWVLLDPLVCVLASSMTSFKGLLRWKGYLYDRVCHESFLNGLKRE